MPDRSEVDPKRLAAESEFESHKGWYAAAGRFIVCWSAAESMLDACICVFLGIQVIDIGRLVTIPLDAARKIKLLEKLIPLAIADPEDREFLLRAVGNLDHARIARTDIAHGFFNPKELEDSPRAIRWGRGYNFLERQYPIDKLMNLSWWTEAHGRALFYFLESRGVLPKRKIDILLQNSSGDSDSES